MTPTYIIASRAPLIRLPDAHLKFECNVLHSNVDFYFKFDEYSKFKFFLDSPKKNPALREQWMQFVFQGSNGVSQVCLLRNVL